MSDCEFSVEESNIENGLDEEQCQLLSTKSRRFSALWKVFTPQDDKIAICNLCGKHFSYKSSTSNLKKHLHCRHLAQEKHLNVKPLQNHVDLTVENASRVALEEIVFAEPPSIKNNPTESIFDIPTRDSRKGYMDPRQLSSENRLTHDRMVTSDLPISCILKEGERRTHFCNDEYDALGMAVATKLRKMNETQRIDCERIIHDALYKGLVRQLSPFTHIVLEGASSGSNKSPMRSIHSKATSSIGTMTINTWHKMPSSNIVTTTKNKLRTSDRGTNTDKKLQTSDIATNTDIKLCTLDISTTINAMTQTSDISNTTNDKTPTSDVATSTDDKYVVVVAPASKKPINAKKLPSPGLAAILGNGGLVIRKTPTT